MSYQLKIIEKPDYIKYIIPPPTGFIKKGFPLLMSMIFIYVLISILISNSDSVTMIMAFLILPFLIFEGFQVYFWLIRGYEVLEINLEEQEVRFYRKGITTFNKRNFKFKEISFFERTPSRDLGNIESGDRSSLVLGLRGGKIRFGKTLRKKIEFGTSLSDLEVENIILKVQQLTL